jgi:HD-GYP domain-containing protein (c-di-GMP phosphodiesterase class II)
MNTSVGDLVQLFAGGITHGTLYFKDHPRVREVSERTHAALQEYLTTSRRDALFVGVVRGRLVADGKPLLGATLAARRLVECLKKLRAGGFLLKQSLDANQLRDLFGIGHELGSDLASLAAARTLLNERGITSVELSPPFGDPGWLGVPLAGGGVVGDDDAELPAPVVTCVQQLHDAVEVVFAAVAQDRVPEVGLLNATVERVLKPLLADLPRAIELAHYSDYDRYVVGHSVRVALLLAVVARAHGLDEARIADVIGAGLLHDVGKARVASAILHKRAALSDDERQVMQRHVEDGTELLAVSAMTTPLMLEVALCHHVREDGRGYPQLAAAKRRGEWSRLTYVVDVFEALTAARPHQKGRAARRAFEILANDPGGADPAALATFARAVGLHPPGGHVRFTSGQFGRVVAATARFDRPQVVLTHDAVGMPLPRRKSDTELAAALDLSQPENAALVVADYLFQPQDAV